MVDFETEAIAPRPKYPPKPVGVAVGELRGGRIVGATYHSWGHRHGYNGTTKAAAGAVLRDLWRDPGVELVFHNSKFDLDVAETHLGLALPPWQRVHDTIYLLYLDDPRAPDLKLKPSAERLLGQKPDERDAVRDWLVSNGVVKKNQSDWGAYISHAPPSVVGPYAVGDVKRTGALFHKLEKVVRGRGMWEAYERERRLMPLLLDNERRGIRLDLDALRADVAEYSDALLRTDRWIARRLGAPGLDLDKDAQLVEALDGAGLVDEWVLTPGGKRSTSKANLKVNDAKLAAALRYRGALATCLRTFMQPWLATAEGTGGWIHTNWNQVRGDNDKGTRTGRFSSNPNLQNIPNDFKVPGFGLRVPPLPRVRRYVVADDAAALLGSLDYCFSPDTEVLTDRGWVAFPELDRTERVAQWRDGEVSFAAPLDWQVVDYDGPMYRIRGERSTDLLVSENHRCLVERVRNGATELCFVKPAEYPIGCARQHHAGVLPGDGTCNADALRLAVAVQADAKIQGAQAVFLLKKRRKIDRLLSIAAALGLGVSLTNALPSKPGFQRVSIPWSAASPWLDVEGGKRFRRAPLMALRPELRRAFLDELAHWDGSVKTEGRNWYYASTNVDNADLVSELAAVTGLRPTLREYALPSGKRFLRVNLRTRPWTNTDTYAVTKYDYRGKIYCVTMPWSTVVVRRNGRVCVTGQSQQELRALAHFEDGALLRAYAENPLMDIHVRAASLLFGVREQDVTDEQRRFSKTIGFGLIYGMGVAQLAERMGVDEQRARTLKRGYLAAMPGVKGLMDDLTRRARTGLPIRTWGGREYFCEPPRMVVDKRTNQKVLRSFEYKMLNILVQGSSADCTKEAMVRYGETRRDGRFLAQIHDQVLISAPRGAMRAELGRLREAMESVEFDVKMVTDSSVGPCWADLKDVEDVEH